MCWKMPCKLSLNHVFVVRLRLFRFKCLKRFFWFLYSACPHAADIFTGFFVLSRLYYLLNNLFSNVSFKSTLEINDFEHHADCFYRCGHVGLVPNKLIRAVKSFYKFLLCLPTTRFQIFCKVFFYKKLLKSLNHN